MQSRIDGSFLLPKHAEKACSLLVLPNLYCLCKRVKEQLLNSAPRTFQPKADAKVHIKTIPNKFFGKIFLFLPYFFCLFDKNQTFQSFLIIIYIRPRARKVFFFCYCRWPPHCRRAQFAVKKDSKNLVKNWKRRIFAANKPRKLNLPLLLTNKINTWKEHYYHPCSRQ